MLDALVVLVVGLFRSRASLVAENELLRQQLAAAKCRLQGKRVMFTASQRLTIALLTRLSASWQATVTLDGLSTCSTSACLAGDEWGCGSLGKAYELGWGTEKSGSAQMTLTKLCTTRPHACRSTEVL
jgi:hypothetical protein